GRPPMPSAMSSISEPVLTTSTASTRPSPMRMTAPLPNCFSIWPSAAASARFLFSSIVVVLVIVDWCRDASLHAPIAQAATGRRGWNLAPAGRPGRRASPHPAVGKCPAPPSPARPHQPAVQALDGEVLSRLDLDGGVVGVARQQPDAVLADLQQLDGDGV